MKQNSIQLSKIKVDSQESWKDPTFMNGASNYGGEYDTVQYMKDGLGFVHIKGMGQIQNSNQIMFVLPIGYRPAKLLQFVSITGGGFGVINITKNGEVSRVVGAGPTTSFSVCFRAV